MVEGLSQLFFIPWRTGADFLTKLLSILLWNAGISGNNFLTHQSRHSKLFAPWGDGYGKAQKTHKS